MQNPGFLVHPRVTRLQLRELTAYLPTEECASRRTGGFLSSFVLQKRITSRIKNGEGGGEEKIILPFLVKDDDRQEIFFQFYRLCCLLRCQEQQPCKTSLKRNDGSRCNTRNSVQNSEFILPDPTLKLGKVKIFLNFDYILNRVAQRFYPILRNSVPMLRRSGFGNHASGMIIPYPEPNRPKRYRTGKNCLSEYVVHASKFSYSIF